MKKTFEQLKENFEQRFQNHSILLLGEDSLRYDFFDSLVKNWQLKSHQIQLEYPIHKDLYNSIPNPNSKRPESPQIDLIVYTEKLKMIAEFALFKRNSNIKGAINSSEKLFKMINDFLRLGNSLTKFNGNAFFICIADGKMLGAKFRNGNFESFPAKKYELEINHLEQLSKSYKTSSKIDIRFLSKYRELGTKINAKLVYNEAVVNPDIKSKLYQDNILETRVIIYEISLK